MNSIITILLTPFILFAMDPSDSPKELTKTKPTAQQLTGFDHQHKVWTEVLKKYVVSKGALSQVKYKDLKNKPQQFLSYLGQLSSVKKTDFESWTEKQRMAFLINAYNAFTLKLIIDNYPVKSIKDIGSFFSSPWEKEFFSLFGKKTYLDFIEHKVLRKKFQEPRIHFAVNCASVGCPALRAEAFTAENLDAQLQQQAQIFMGDSTRNRIDLKNKSIFVSPIFKWFKEDFGKSDAKVIRYVLAFLSEQKIEEAVINELKLNYTDYDWSLNEI